MTTRNVHIALTVLAAFLFIPFLGHVHLFDWDEINFAEAAREMLVTGNWSRVTIDYQPFWEKPPLFIWMQAVCMRLFGVNEFAARLPNAIAGIVTINLLFKWGTKYVNVRTGLFWAVLYLGSLTPFFYFKTGIIDPVFNLFIVLAIIQLFKAKRAHESGLRSYLISGILIGLAVLTKGPVGALIPALVLLMVWATGRFRWFFDFRQVAVLVVSAIAVASIWFIPEVIKNGTGVIQNFIDYQIQLMASPVASHGQPWYYHIIVLFFGCFPASVFAIPRLIGHHRSNDLDRWMLALFWVVLILFSSVTTKIVHYSSLCWFPLAYLAARQLSAVKKISPVVTFLYALAGVIIGLLFILIPWIGVNRAILLKLQKDPIHDVQAKAMLYQDVPWSGMEWIPGLAFFMLVVVSVVYLFRNRLSVRWVVVHFMAIAFIINVLAAVVVPKAEQHIQGKLIGFYEDVQDMDVYIRPLHFKTYAHLYYARVSPPESTDSLYRRSRIILDEFGVDEITDLNHDDRNKYNQRINHYLLTGELDKNALFVIERRKRHKLKDYDVDLIYDAGPFLVYLRNPVRQTGK